MTRAVRLVSTPVVLACGAVVLFAGVAAAAYRSNVAATGTGRATPAAAGATLTLTVTGTAATGLYPGGPGADVTVTLANPYDRPVTVTAVTAAGPVVATPVSGRACVSHAVTLAAPASGLPATVPAAGSATITLRAAMTMGLASDSGCQGASFAVPLTILGRL